jgi:uncharacterized glyoxalase superfamily protein PhnB
MFEIAQLVPIVPSPDIAASVRFYQQLGFLDPWMWTDQHHKTHDSNTSQTIVYGGLDQPLELHFHRVTDKSVLENTLLRIRIAGDIQAFFQQCLELGCVHPNSELKQMPWGRLEFAVLDPGGVCVYFWQEVV